MMRWQGTTIASGLRPVAAPAARALPGMARAPRELGVRNRGAGGHAPRSPSTRSCWNGVPAGASGKSNARRSAGEIRGRAARPRGAPPETRGRAPTRDRAAASSGRRRTRCPVSPSRTAVSRRRPSGRVDEIEMDNRFHCMDLQRWMTAYARHGRHASARASARAGCSTPSALRTTRSLSRKASGQRSARMAM